MKLKLFFYASLITLSACEMDLFDHKDKENRCPIVESSNLPLAVKDSFDLKYGEAATNVTWFNKDGAAFVALFNNNNVQTKSTFNTDGQFVSESLDEDKNEECNKNDDDDDDDTGCECELEDDE